MDVFCVSSLKAAGPCNQVPAIYTSSAFGKSGSRGGISDSSTPDIERNGMAANLVKVVFSSATDFDFHLASIPSAFNLVLPHSIAAPASASVTAGHCSLVRGWWVSLNSRWQSSPVSTSCVSTVRSNTFAEEPNPNVP